MIRTFLLKPVFNTVGNWAYLKLLARSLPLISVGGETGQFPDIIERFSQIRLVETFVTSGLYNTKLGQLFVTGFEYAHPFSPFVIKALSNVTPVTGNLFFNVPEFIYTNTWAYIILFWVGLLSVPLLIKKTHVWLISGLSLGIYLSVGLLILSSKSGSVNFSWFALPEVASSFIVERLFNDGLSILFILLTGFITLVCFQLSSSINYNKLKFCSLLFILFVLLLGCFLTTNLLLFYVFFEATLIPIYLIITRWGSQTDRARAGYLLFLYTIVGSTFLLAALAIIHLGVGSFWYDDLKQFLPELGYMHQCLIWGLLVIGLGVKVPMYFLHSWLTVAHVEAPTIGSVLLASLLLKLGGYGLIRFPLTLFPLISQDLGPIVYIVGVLGFTYTSFCALRQFDLKRFVAYTSIAHMNLAVGGLFFVQENSYLGSIHTMVSHGVIAGALFILVGVLYDRTHVRNISYYSGLSTLMPRFSVYFFLFMLANAGMPFLSGFPGEFLTFLGTAHINFILTLPLIIGFICTIGYTILVLTRILFGTPSTQFISFSLADITLNEKKVLNDLTLLTFMLGLFPSLVFAIVELSSF